MGDRSGAAERITNETSVRVRVDLDGGEVRIATGVPFFDHMLDQVARHGRLGLRVDAQGDLEVDAHHTVEDVGIVFGEAIVRALGEKRGIRRYGDALVPMEESLAQAAIDISGRPLLVFEADIPAESIGQYDVGLTEEFLRALCRGAGLTLHVTLRRRKDPHHATEAIFKAVARALGQALEIDPRASGEVPSTKGML